MRRPGEVVVPPVDVAPAAGDRRQRDTLLHFRRIEMKYVLPRRMVPELVERLAPYVHVDPFLAGTGRSSYPVTSLYFDSFNLQSLFEKEAGWLSRRRIRLRTYAEDFAAGATMFFEIKRRHDFLVFKDRFPLTPTEEEAEAAADRRITLRHLLERARDGSVDAAEEALLLDAWYNLQPTTLVTYDRLAFIGMGDPELRITIDHDLRGMWRPRALAAPHVRRRCPVHPMLPRLHSYGAHQPRGMMAAGADAWVILELKFAHGIPAWLHNLITSMELERSAYSKYSWATRALRPRLFDATDDPSQEDD